MDIDDSIESVTERSICVRLERRATPINHHRGRLIDHKNPV